MTEAAYRVTGRVVLKETGAGIPDLTVVAYDLDHTEQSRAALLARLRSREAVAEHGFWSAIPGDRLGSVLTGRDGSFALAFDRESFATGDEGNGPDLTLFVLAPDDVSAEEDPTGCLARPPGERLLYSSCSPIANAGRSEAVLIRLPQALLDRFQTRSPAPQARLATRLARTLSVMDESASLRTAVAARKDADARAAIAPILERRKVTTNAFKTFSLSRWPESVRSGPGYASHGEPVHAKLVELVDRRLDEIPRVLDRHVDRRLRFRLPRPDLPDWGIRVDPGTGTATGEVDFKRVVDMMKRAVSGGPLERSRSWLEIACAERRAPAVFEETLTGCAGPAATPGGPSNGTSEPPALTASALVKEQVARQMQHVTAPEVELSYGALVDGRITATITRPGPTDVTAFHDFQELQIAFEHVWTEAFDGRLPRLFQDVYDEMVKFEWRASGVSSLPAVATVDDMQRLYEDFRSLKELIEKADEKPPEPPQEVPARVLTLVPAMTAAEQAELIALADRYADADDVDAGDIAADVFSTIFTGVPIRTAEREQTKSQTRKRGGEIQTALKLRAATRQKASPAPAGPRSPVTSSRLDALFRELDERLAEPYRFDLFAPDSINLGIMLTYRQKWVPLDYQVGSLVSTVPLAPKEVRRYSTKRVVKKTRSERELDDREQASRLESSSTSRADSEIVRQARDKTSFETTANGTINVGVFQGQFGTRFGVDAEKSSSQTKKNFREAVLKSADEFRQKHSVEVQISSSEEVETVASGEVSNPNDEIAVTYLFYELQRQYEIGEQLHRLTPVILVANAVPKPHEIDEDWLLAHHWILSRAILDDGLRPALHYLTTSLAGDELALEALRQNVERQVALVEELTKQLQSKTRLAEESFEELKTLVRHAATADEAQKMQNIAMAMMLGPFALAGGSGDDEAAEKREEIAKMALERADQAAQQVTAKLTREVTAMQEAIDKYVAALRSHFDHAVAIAELRIHVKQNILYYMQAIWDHEPPDQRFFRLYNVEVPWIVDSDDPLTVPVSGSIGPASDFMFEVPMPLVDLDDGSTYYRRTTRKLSEVADLDNLLGYKGNYMIFAAREPSYMHLYMMQDYVDPDTGGLRDPDGFTEMSSRELLDSICCLQRHAPGYVTEHRDELLALVTGKLASARRESDLVVVPTDSLYIEALPGAHPVMEGFKRVHRALDVKKVQAEVRQAEIENLRLAARLLKGEREDPNIEKRIEVRGTDLIEVDT